MKTLLNNKLEADLVCLTPVPPGRRTARTSSKTIRATLLALLAVAGLFPASAQVSFTRVLEGDIANDAGNFTGCAWGDYDNDGNVDLFVGNQFGLTNRLYHNSGNGTFARITTGKLVNEPADADGSVWGDYDNDGFLDLYVANSENQNDFLYHNEGRTYNPHRFH